MSVDAKHPVFEDFARDWETMRFCAAGERAVKEQNYTFLPFPSGFSMMSDKGVGAYQAYQLRAQYPDLLVPTLQGMVGVIHRVEAQIEGLDEKKPLAHLWEKATKDGLTLEAFHRRITAELLLMGRFEILTDVSTEGDGDPYFVGYTTEQLINWSDPQRDLFVFDESALEREIDVDEFAWVDRKKYRVLRLRDGVYTQQLYDNTAMSVIGEEVTPQMRGGKALDKVPLVVVGPREVSLLLDPPPLIGVAKSALALYRLDADYRHQLYNSGQETLFVIGTDEVPKVTGSGVIINLPLGADAKYVGVSGSGITAHRQAILDERQNAVAAGVKLFDSQKAAESGEALRLRAAAQTATLTTIALASAAALEQSLRYAAMFVGQNPDEVIVKPNLDFVDTRMTAQDASALVRVWQAGAISKQSLFDNFQRGEIVTMERTFDEEEELIKQEIADQPMAVEGQQQPLGPGNGMGNGATPPQIDSRFVEDGSGLIIE